MAIFQSSVLKKYLKQLDATEVAKAYKKYTKYFHEPTIQQNIKDSNEEQFQATFLNELFVKILGFTLNPQPKYNLTTEFKNVKNARKADGAILLKDEALAVIELKGTNTKDLESIRQQAFDYKANQPGCVYVITSNFEKLRFYINNAVDFEEFDLFNLSYNRFELLYLCLYKEHLLSNLPLKIKEASIHEEEAITKKFYSDYSLFKRELFRDIVKRNLRNPELKELGEVSSKKTLFKKTQKLLDRFLFIFFGEDRGLLPPNSIPKILDQWKQLKKMDAYSPLYERYKKYFSYLNEGWKGEDHEIFAYNGGLFKPDPVLDTIEIDDELLFKHTSVLTKYDFESQVDVNILGHIFEHSLNEIESINAEIEGVEFDKQKSKRKKDGVFYTPKYITKYIVDNTVGKLCEEKQAELEMHEEEYLKGPKHRAKKTIQKLDEQLQAYRDWLLTLTICDPACGSGAFLNQALEFLIQEHRWIDEMTAKLFGGGLVFQDVENSILENNIYGVDLNDESVEIAKLSLWLRTAQKGRKLTSLNNNIKCGNSLIDSKAVAGDKAFTWEEEFPEVFAKGGFDVVIGNPPYVQSHSLDEITKNYIYKNYETSEYQINTYGVFLEKILSLVKDDKTFSVIIPNYWLSTKYDSKLRSQLFLKNHCTEILNVFGVFKDATVDTVIVTVKRTDNTVFPKTTKVLALNRSLENIDLRLSAIDSRSWFFSKMVKFDDLSSDISISFDERIELNGTEILGDYIKGFQGMKPYEKGKGSPPQLREMMNEKIYHSSFKKDETYYPLIGAKNVKRFFLKEPTEYIKYGKNLAAPRKMEIFEGERLLLNRILSRDKIDITFVSESIISNTDVFSLVPKINKDKLLKMILAILGSKLCATYFKRNNVNLDRKAYPKLNVNHIENLPVPALNNDKIEIFDNRINVIMDLNSQLDSRRSVFLNYIEKQFNIQSFSLKIQLWYSLDFSDFIKELNKAIKKAGGEKLSKMDEMEWMEVFEAKKKEALELKAEIDKTDREIDQLVYELYGLTDEEIKIVEQT
ncbi:MAG: N-6 DNA methylase [Brumimicrobium sp.]